MKKRTRKIMVSVAAGLTGSFATTAPLLADSGGNTVTKDDFPGGTIEHAVDLIFAGEAGEGGIGMTRMWPHISIPALTGDQLRVVISGNTIGRKDKDAQYFSPTGKTEGWSVEWKALPASEFNKCPSVPVVGDDYYISENGICNEKEFVTYTGDWTISEHQLCTPVADLAGEKDRCFHVALVNDKVVRFNAEGAQYKTAVGLMKGRVVDITN